MTFDIAIANAKHIAAQTSTPRYVNLTSMGYRIELTPAGPISRKVEPDGTVYSPVDARDGNATNHNAPETRS